MLAVDPMLKQQVVAFLEERPDLGEFSSSWLSSEIGADDLGYADSNDQDIHVVYALQELLDEGKVTMTLWGECPCGADCYREPDQGAPRCLSCGFEVDADTPLYRFREEDTEPFLVARSPRRRKSALAERR